jgi:hypothetical protein
MRFAYLLAFAVLLAGLAEAKIPSSVDLYPGDVLALPSGAYTLGTCSGILAASTVGTYLEYAVSSTAAPTSCNVQYGGKKMQITIKGTRLGGSELRGKRYAHGGTQLAVKLNVTNKKAYQAVKKIKEYVPPFIAEKCADINAISHSGVCFEGKADPTIVWEVLFDAGESKELGYTITDPTGQSISFDDAEVYTMPTCVLALSVSSPQNLADFDEGSGVPVNYSIRNAVNGTAQVATSSVYINGLLNHSAVSAEEYYAFPIGNGTFAIIIRAENATVGCIPVNATLSVYGKPLSRARLPEVPLLLLPVLAIAIAYAMRRKVA